MNENMFLKIFIFLTFVTIIKSAYCEFDNGLLQQSILYGISHLNENATDAASQCEKDLNQLFNDVENRRVWALKVLDASGGPGSGFFYGNNFWTGSYAQCADLHNTKSFEIDYRKIKQPNKTIYDFPPYKLDFFVAHLLHDNTLQVHTQLPLEYIIELGLCAPASCTPKLLQQLLTKYFDLECLTFQKLNNLHLNVTQVRRVKEVGLWFFQQTNTLILIALISVILILTIIGTSYDLRSHEFEKNIIQGNLGNLAEKEHTNNASHLELVSNSSSNVKSHGTFGEMIKCFSLYSNWNNLIKCELSPNSIPVIHGIKFFGMLWVVMVHAVFYQADYANNVAVAYRLSEDMFAQILSNSSYSVDTYFFLSGFLLAYLFYINKQSKSDDSFLKKVLQFFSMFLNRFLRLTPLYLFTILSTDVTYSYFRKASVLYSSEQNAELCPKYWWRNILYINNLYPRCEMCMSWSWYLSADTQFFAIALFLLLLSTTKFKLSAMITISLILVNIIATTYTSYKIEYIPTMDNQLKELDSIYDLPWNRIGAYLIGIITAYVYVVKLDQKLILRRSTKTIFWILFPMFNIWILFTLYSRNLSVEFSAIYMGISRILWAVGLAWLLIACCTGNARALEKFLSYPAWIPMSRLTYCAYLVNPLVANMIYLGSNHSFNASRASLGLVTQGIAMSTFFIALIVSVLIESPSMLLTKMLFRKIQQGATKST